MLFWFFSGFVGLMSMLLAIAFLTLMERKILSYSQIRVGPNKTMMLGMIQPVLDGLKLLNKQTLILWKVQWLSFVLSPMMMFCVLIIVWCWILPWNSNMFSNKFMLLALFFLLGVSAYSLIMSGWASYSVFSKLGSMRGVLQNLSFEILLAVTYLTGISFMFSTFSLKYELSVSPETLLVWMILWGFLSLLESNRAPFDLSEGESELISGFNIEMGAINFVFLFLSEYGSVIVMSILMILGGLGEISWISSLIMLLLLLLRSCFPRVRYDTMMSFTWMIMLPLSITLMVTTIFFR